MSLCFYYLFEGKNPMPDACWKRLERLHWLSALKHKVRRQRYPFSAIRRDFFCTACHSRKSVNEIRNVRIFINAIAIA